MATCMQVSSQNRVRNVGVNQPSTSDGRIWLAKVYRRNILPMDLHFALKRLSGDSVNCKWSVVKIPVHDN